MLARIIVLFSAQYPFDVNPTTSSAASPSDKFGISAKRMSDKPKPIPPVIWISDRLDVVESDATPSEPTSAPTAMKAPIMPNPTGPTPYTSSWKTGKNIRYGIPNTIGTNPSSSRIGSTL